MLPAELKSRLELADVKFIDNSSLRSEATKAGLTKAETDELVKIDTDARLGSLRLSFFALALLAALGAIAARRLPDLAEKPSARASLT